MKKWLMALAMLAATQPAFAFDGSYADRRAGRNSVLVIKKAPDGRLTVSAEIKGRRCMGQFDGIGAIRNDQLIAAQKPEGGETCTLTISKAPGQLTVEEDSCLFAHGASCEFSGIYRPAKK